MTNLTWPPTAQTIQTSAETVTDQVAGEMSQALGRLTAIESDAAYGRSALSTQAQALLSLRAELSQLMVLGQVITASPYHYEVGDKLQSGHYLSPNNARDILAAKLKDKADKHRPTGALHCIAFLVTASNKAKFAELLATLVHVFTVPDWLKVARQAAAVVTNEQDKFHVPAAITQPRFKPGANVNANPLREYSRQQGAEIATLESLANDATNVIGKLGALAQKRSDTLEQVKAAINALKQLQGSVWAVKFEGSHESIASQLQSTAMPNNEQHSLMSLMISKEPMTFFEELLGC